VRGGRLDVCRRRQHPRADPCPPGYSAPASNPGHREERTLTSDAEILAAYRRYFGITLDRVPAIDASRAIS
jgi:hypothetical protein